MAEPELLRIYDNTQISTHKNCERKFFYRHVLDLRAEGLAPAPAFGLAWHKGMDFIWPAMSKDPNASVSDLVKGAYIAWEKDWEEWGFPGIGGHLDEEWKTLLKGRYTPDTALEMFANYVEARRRLITVECKLLAVEQSFAVPLTSDDPGLFYCGRLDKIVEWEDGVYIIDHKTTSLYRKDGYFRSDFIDSFSPDSQLDGYAYAGRMLFGDRFKGLLIDAALVHKDVHDGFRLVPVKRAVDQLDAWLWETREEVERLEVNVARVQHNIDAKHFDVPYLAAFRKNPMRCMDFFTPCSYLDMCKGFSNPLSEVLLHGTPQGYKVEQWSPFDANKLERLGFKKESVRR